MAGTTKPTPKATPKPTATAGTTSALDQFAASAGITPEMLAEARARAASSGSSTTTKTPVTETAYPQIYSDTQARSFITKQFQDILNREPSPTELTKYTGLLKAAQQNLKNAAVQKYNVSGSKAVSPTVTGLDEAQWFLDQVQKDKTLNSEYQAVKTQAPEVTKLQADKRIYDKLIAEAGPNLDKINAAKQNTTYGRKLTELESEINDMIMTRGATTDPGKAAEIAKQLVDRGLDLRTEAGKSLVESQLGFGKNKLTVGDKTYDAFTGEAGQNVAALNKVALANGLTLDKVFDSTVLPEVLAAVSKGEPVDTYAKIIRDAAKVAWNVSDNVAKLMDQGVSLDSIYSPYKNTLANTLELDPNSVTLNDLAKFGIVGQPSATSQTPQNLYDFQKALRKDERWQYTQQAHQEVASGIQKVLQDFGFMG